jgi:signal transduction histidine kinase
MRRSMPRRGTSPIHRHARIRTRLLALLAVPLTGLLLVTVFQAVGAWSANRDAGRLLDRAQLAVAADRLVDTLQDERQLLAAGRPSTPQSRDAVRVATDAVITEAASAPPGLADAVDRALGRVRAAGSLAASSTGGLVAVDGYTPAVRQLLAVSDRALDAGESLDGDPATLAGLLAGAEEAASLERALITAAAAGRTLSSDQLRQINESGAAQRILTGEAASIAGPALRPRIDELGDVIVAAQNQRDRLQLGVGDADATGDGAGEAVNAWLGDAATRDDDLRSLRDAATAASIARVHALASSSRTTFLLSTLASVAAAIIGLLLVRRAIRSIARPLQELAAQAEEVALSRLPAAVRSQQDVDGGAHLPSIRATGAAEVREVAAAFNDVQQTALRLAAEQATLRRNQADALTNLGRRNQTLIGRQLDFISELERRETDPVFLEHLFRLDHLANRMRRNAESILVLAGSDTPRRRRTPAAVSEVVRSAMGEVEDFERIRLGDLGDVTVTGPVVIDLVHLLAELVENALRFSPPDTTVQVEGRPLGQGGYQLAVIDHGVGLSDVELRAATERMSAAVEVDGMPTRYLGQYVIAKLSVRTGAQVHLQPTVGARGVTAVVTLPPAAVVGGRDLSGVAQPLPGSRGGADEDAVIAPGQGMAPAGYQVPSGPRHVDLPVVGVGSRAGLDATPESLDLELLPLLDAPTVAPVVRHVEVEGVDAAGSLTSPPPVPAAVPDQHAWSPRRGGGADPFAPVPPTTPGVGHSAAPGGLTRRVPGAHLPGGGASAPATPTRDGRSPEGVRSMLAAFQSGRARGSVDGDPLDEPSLDPGRPTPAPHDAAPAPWGPAREDEV